MKLRQTPARSSTKASRKRNASTKILQEQMTDSSDSDIEVSFKKIAPFSDDEDCVPESRSSTESKQKRPSRSNGAKGSPKIANKRENAHQTQDKSINELDLKQIIDRTQISTVMDILHQLPDHFAEEYCKYLFALQDKVSSNPNINKTRQIQYSKPKLLINDTCVICGRKFSSLRKLNKHVTAEHETPDGFYCTSCDKQFPTLVKFNHHVTFIHLIVYPCSYCNSSFQGISDLNEHLTSAHPGKNRFMCTVCNKGFSKSALLMMHINLHTGLTPHKCKHCPKAYATTDSLREHVRHHNKDKFQFKCNECGKIFCSKKLLNVHALIHGTERKFKCTLCAKAFKTYQNLVHHHKTHSAKVGVKVDATTESDSNQTSKCYKESKTLQEETKNTEPVLEPNEIDINKHPLELQKTIFGDFKMDSDSDEDETVYQVL